MKIRDALLNTYRELSNEVAYAVEVDTLLRRVMKRSFDGVEVTNELQAAIREGDLVITSPGMIEISESAASHSRGCLATA